MEIYIAGGCSEHGRNCFLISSRKLSVMVDCGYIKSPNGLIPPELSDEQISSVRYLFITHGHVDHGGALGWLYERGFTGKVICTRKTEEMLKTPVKEGVYPEECSKTGELIQLDEEVSFRWGRTGHCAGSLWYDIHIGRKNIFFSGDYSEKSAAYKCDCVRGLKADAAVIDVAYARESKSAPAHKRELRKRLKKAAANKEVLLFPVPSNGRGMDLIRYLNEAGIPAYVEKKLLVLFRQQEKNIHYLKKGLNQILKENKVYNLEEWNGQKGCAGLLVADSQLEKEPNRELAGKVKDLQGHILFTGRTRKGTEAERLVGNGEAEFYRISVHQNVKEMKNLVWHNHFKMVIPNHTEQVLKFHKSIYHILKAGDRIRI